MNGSNGFELLAYGGGKIVTPDGDSLVIDLRGIKVNSIIPVGIGTGLEDDNLIGQASSDGIVNDGQKLIVCGVVTADPRLSPRVGKLIASGGKDWRVRIRCSYLEAENVGDFDTVRLNGRELAGPFTLVTACELRACCLDPRGERDTGIKFLKASSRSIQLRAEVAAFMLRNQETIEATRVETAKRIRAEAKNGGSFRKV